VILRVVVMDISRHGSRASLRAQSENSTLFEELGGNSNSKNSNGITILQSNLQQDY
jgi:hypothetical protein